MDQTQSDNQRSRRSPWSSRGDVHTEQSAGTGVTGPAPARSGRTHGPAWRVALSDHVAIPLWVVPTAALTVALLVIGGLMLLSRLDDLDVLERRVVALHARSENQTIVSEAMLRTELQHVNARIDGLGTRLDAARDLRDTLNSIRRALSKQQDRVDALAARLDGLAGNGAANAAPEREPGYSSSVDKHAGSKGAAASGETWVINVVSLADPASARQVEQRLGAMGIDARVDMVEMNRRSLRRIVVPGFDSRAEARDTASRLHQQLGLSEEPWISRQQ